MVTKSDCEVDVEGTMDMMVRGEYNEPVSGHSHAPLSRVH
jgi:hypothetical protein